MLFSQWKPSVYWVSYFPALFTGGMNLCAFRRRVFPHNLPLAFFLCLSRVTCFPALFTGNIFSRSLQRLRLVLAVCFPALSIAPHYKHLLLLLSLAAVFSQVLSFSLQVDSKDSPRLLDGMFNKTALSCSLLRLLRSRQVHWVYLFEAVILVATL